LFLKCFVIVTVILLVWGCAVVPTIKEGSEGAYLRLPYVRVLLENSKSELAVDCNGPLTVESIRGTKSYVYHSSLPVTVRPRAGGLSIWSGKQLVDDNFDKLMIIPRQKKDLLSYSKHPYRGMFIVTIHGQNLRLVNNVHIDDYLKGVVPPEIGKVGEPEFEAIKAQAVAARTYAMARFSQYPGEPYDLKSDVSDQLYHGVKVENNIVSRAIDQTRGYVLKYDGRLIDAYYHSTCGGLTDDIDEVWDKPGIPYLQSVYDGEFGSWSKYYNWEESYNAEQLKMRIEQYLSSDRGKTVRIGDILDIIVKEKTVGGRVASLVVRTTSGDYHFGRDRIRWVFKRSSNPEMILQSARFEVVVKKDSQGRLKRANFRGSGYGHGVGMCQCGAIGRSRAGHEFDKILTHYYRSVDLVKLY
jgi:stage II sporulation protein D